MITFINTREARIQLLGAWASLDKKGDFAGRLSVSPTQSKAGENLKCHSYLKDTTGFPL